MTPIVGNRTDAFFASSHSPLRERYKQIRDSYFDCGQVGMSGMPCVMAHRIARDQPRGLPRMEFERVKRLAQRERRGLNGGAESAIRRWTSSCASLHRQSATQRQGSTRSGMQSLDDFLFR
jgi:hypothetical protein